MNGELDLNLILQNQAYIKYDYIKWDKIKVFHMLQSLLTILCNVVYFQRDCPNGQLTRAKFLEVYASFFPDGNAEKFCEHVFRTFDADNSGKIDFKEFLLAINITSAGKPEQKLEWAFAMYDINGDGTIEQNEMKEIIGVGMLAEFCGSCYLYSLVLWVK